MKRYWFKNTKYGLWPNDTHGWILFIVSTLIAIATFVSFYFASRSVSTAAALFSPYLLVDAVVFLTVAYLTSAKSHWFVAKIYGWGWTPATWQAWFILSVFIGMLIELLMLSVVLTSIDPLLGSYITMSGTLALTTLMILVCYATGERPRWRWGK